MDVETAEAVDTLRTDIRRLEETLTGKIVGVEASLTATIEHVETLLVTKMRHTDVRIESMHDDIRLLAENLASLGVQMSTLRK